jgi:hypothetical protein
VLDDAVFTRRAKIVLAVSSPLRLPLAIGAGIIVVPIVLGMEALQSVKAVHYRSNKLKYIMDWRDIVLDTYSQTTIYKLMEDTYLNDFNMKVQFVCENVILKFWISVSWI